MTIRQLNRTEMPRIAKGIGFHPSKASGQYFLHDTTTVRKVATVSGAHRDDDVLEVGAGLGSSTLALLGKGCHVTAVDIDAALARQLPVTIAEHSHGEIARLDVLHRDVMTLSHSDIDCEPTVLVLSLPAHLVEAALLHLLTEFPSIGTALLATEFALAERLAAEPCEPKYHPAGVRLRLFGTVHRYGPISPSAFWPIPRSHHGLVRLNCDPRNPWRADTQSRAEVFELIDIAFAHRRNNSRNAFAEWAGSGNESASRLLTASIDPSRRADDLTINDFVRLQQRTSGSSGGFATGPQPLRQRRD
jgi:16S rRNA (adenine1518-N6/adenine1519-N6)-dimethyltransferase